MLLTKQPSLVLWLDFLLFGSKVWNYMLLTGTLKESPLSYTPTLCSKSSSILHCLVLEGRFSRTVVLFHWKFLIVMVFSWRNIFAFHVSLRSSASYSSNVLLTIQYSRNLCLILIWAMSLYIKIFLKTLLALLFLIMHHVRSVFVLKMS